LHEINKLNTSEVYVSYSSEYVKLVTLTFDLLNSNLLHQLLLPHDAFPF